MYLIQWPVSVRLLCPLKVVSNASTSGNNERVNKRRKERVTAKFGRVQGNFTFIPESREERKNIQRVSELCLVNICIMHSDGRTLVSISSASFVSRDCNRPVSRAAQPTERRLSKGRNGLSSPRALRLCYRLVPGEAALGTAAGGKLPLCGALRQKRAGFTVGVTLRNSSAAHVWWDF